MYWAGSQFGGISPIVFCLGVGSATWQHSAEETQNGKERWHWGMPSKVQLLLLGPSGSIPSAVTSAGSLSVQHMGPQRTLRLQNTTETKKNS